MSGDSGGGTEPSIFERVQRITQENQRLFSELIAGERRFRTLARSVWRVQEEERRRLSRELHDGVGQGLTALKQQLEMLRAEPELAPSLSRRLDDAVDLATQTLRDTRELSRLLRPQILDDLGLEPALRWLVRTVGESGGLKAELTVDGLDVRLGVDLETLTFRVVQEALNNVSKHAAAQRVDVEVSFADGLVRLTVADDGKGFDRASVAEDHSGSGLRGMRDRLEFFGGRFEIDSEPGRGTRIAAAVPAPNPSHEANGDMAER